MSKKISQPGFQASKYVPTKIKMMTEIKGDKAMNLPLCLGLKIIPEIGISRNISHVGCQTSVDNPNNHEDYRRNEWR